MEQKFIVTKSQLRKLVEKNSKVVKDERGSFLNLIKKLNSMMSEINTAEFSKSDIPVLKDTVENLTEMINFID